MKRFILAIVLLTLASGAAWAGARLDLDVGILSGVGDSPDTIEVEGETGSEASAVFLGEVSTPVQTQPLAAVLVVSHGNVATLETVTFDASGSLPGDGTIALYEWDLDGDGYFEESSTLGTWEHAYADDGVVFVQVRVTNDLGESVMSQPLQLDIINRLPTAQFAVSLGDNAEGSLVEFEDSSHDLDGVISYWVWDFGDGSTSNEASPTHAYDSAGFFSVTLSVTDNDGDTSDAYVFKIEVVNSGPLAQFTLQQSTVYVAQSLILIDESFDPSVNGEIVHVAWDFGDGAYQAGGPSSDNMYSHVFALPGTYTVTLYVIDNDGAMARTQTTVEVL